MTAPFPRVPSTEAEAASALLFRTLGAHRTATAAIRQRPRPRLHRLPGEDPIQDQCQATLVRLLSITEAFASELLSREVDHAIAGAATATAGKVAEDAVIRGTGTWSDQQRSYKDWLGVNEDWKAVERLAEARNAVAHGLGKLTRRQMRSEQSTKAKLIAAGITVDKNKVVLSEDNLAAAASACRDFVERLDLAVQEKA